MDFNPSGWEQISRPCPECGVDKFYIKPISHIESSTHLDTKEFHKKGCKQLPVIFPVSSEKLTVTDVEFKQL